MSAVATPGRIDKRFRELRRAGRCGLMTFVTACDPDERRSADILRGLPQAGADFIELGVPFTDAMADGPTIQAANGRALTAGVTLPKALGMVEEFRRSDDDTPLTLMGYLNPISRYGVERFLADAQSVGVDGVLVIDLSIEEDDGFFDLATSSGISCIRLATPTTDDGRLAKIASRTSGFLYYVSLAGVTGADGLVDTTVRSRVAGIKKLTELPIAVGFGIRTPTQAASIARTADAVVVGSSIIERISVGLDQAGDQMVPDVLKFISDIAESVRSAR